MKPKRLTPELARQAYITSGAIPVQESLRQKLPDGNTGRCVLGAIAVQRIKDGQQPESPFAVFDRTESYHAGICDGWDDMTLYLEEYQHMPEYHEGVADGKAAMLSLLPNIKYQQPVAQA